MLINSNYYNYNDNTYIYIYILLDGVTIKLTTRRPHYVPTMWVYE